MADRVIALVGPGTGPIVHTGRMGQLLVCFRELTDGEAHVHANDQCHVRDSDCEVALEAASTVQVVYRGKNKKFTCIIRSQVNALSSN